jgi:hypothetical protein
MMGLGVVAGILLGSGTGRAVTCPSPVGGQVVDNVSNYGSNCISPSSPGQPGTNGICMASIAAAIKCAHDFYLNVGPSTDNYILTVGTSTTSLNIDLTHDTSLSGSWEPLTAAFDVEDFKNTPLTTSGPSSGCTSVPQSGCFIIQGDNASTMTTLTLSTVPGQLAILIKNSSHILFKHIILRQPAETMTQGTFVTQGTTTVYSSGVAYHFGNITLDILPPATAPTTQNQNVQDFAAVASGGSGYVSDFPFTISPSAGASCSQSAQVLLGRVDGIPDMHF